MSGLREGLLALFEESTLQLSRYPDFDRLDQGQATPSEAQDFLRRLARTHLKSPRILAFLYAVAPPEEGEAVLHNLLEELGLEEQDGVSHPEMLRQVLLHAGLGDEVEGLEHQAKEDVRRLVTEPLLYGTLRDVGFAAMVETVAFEFMLGRLAGKLGEALGRLLNLPRDGRAWFMHHSEVDVRHAEEGLDNLVRYAAEYGIPADDALALAELTLRENVFIRGYFGTERAEAEA